MKKFLSILVCFLSISIFSEEPPEEHILSTPDQIATLSSEPSYLIGELINPLSGSPTLRQTDLVVKGAQNIVLRRIYIPPFMPESLPKHKKNQEEWNKINLYHHISKYYRGWQYFPHLELELYSKKGHSGFFKLKLETVRLTDPNGITFDIKIEDDLSSFEGLLTDRLFKDLASAQYALSNTFGDIPNGKYDIRNTKIAVAKKREKITVYAPDGAIRFYTHNSYKFKKPRFYLLEKEILSNGKVFKYYYNDTKQLIRIESLDPQERFVYAVLHVSGSADKGTQKFKSPSGLSSTYTFNETFGIGSPFILTAASSPAYRHETISYNDILLLNSYSGKEDIFLLNYTGFGNQGIDYRVHKLLLPVGSTGSFEPVYEFDYDPPIPGKNDGRTIVKNSDGTSTVYHFSKNLLINSIQYFGQDGNLKKEKVFKWLDNNWLQSVEIRDCFMNLLFKRSYTYDNFGNPILEDFAGDLIGDGNQDIYRITREFSQDGRNNLLKERHENGKEISFAYLPNTDLVTAKFTKEGDQIILREFYEYHDCNNLIQKIIDDGNGSDKNDLKGVTQRTITYYNLQEKSPFLHMPENIVETYLENGIEKLLKRIHLIYDIHGNVAEEKVYDAFYKLNKAREQITSYVFDVVRAQVPKMVLDNVFDEKESIADAVKHELTDTMQAFGYEIVKALVTDIQPDEKVKSAMNEINEQQRLRVAAQEKGEAEKILKVKQAEAEAESKKLQGEGIANQRKAIIEGLRISVDELKKSNPEINASNVMSLVLMTQYFDTLKDIGATNKSSTILLSHTPGALKDLAAQLQENIIVGNLTTKTDE